MYESFCNYIYVIIIPRNTHAFSAEVRTTLSSFAYNCMCVSRDFFFRLDVYIRCVCRSFVIYRNRTRHCDRNVSAPAMPVLSNKQRTGALSSHTK